MRLLLDTHILILAVSDPSRLDPAVRDAVASPDNDVLVSAASAWEISIKQALGRIEFPLDELPELLTTMGIETLAISLRHAIAAGSLPRHHNDPFDRMLIAQAAVDNLVLVTDDAVVTSYEVALFGRNPG